ncbi:MAG: histidinol dehydrogenase [Bacteroidales bacterium]|nr:histidinol dehydrogenase [Bacteroidales bacterium]
MRIIINPEKKLWPDILKRPVFDVSGLFESVQSILDEIERNGDKALRELTYKFDGFMPENLEVSEEEFISAGKMVDPALKEAIKLAANNIETFHSAQKCELNKIETMPGVSCWQKSVAIENAGLYIPGGTAPLFSTVLMLAIPARIAGCKEIIMCTPPGKDGSVNPAVLFAARYAGVKKVFRLGGVQAVGAMAFGTESVPKADKIFGPGNQYVTAAKQLVSLSHTAVDMPAGPSEVMVVADRSADPSFVASDLLSQAEHGTDSQVVLITDSPDLVEKVTKEISLQLEKLPRKKLAEQSLENSVIIVLNNEEFMADIINTYAPEHLILSTINCHELAEKVVNAGSVFLGNLTPESAGDYASGTNHTLPTNGWARAYSGVNLDSFMKKITFQEISGEGLINIGPAIELMAEAELLAGHKNAVTLRLNTLT